MAATAVGCMVSQIAWLLKQVLLAAHKNVRTDESST